MTQGTSGLLAAVVLTATASAGASDCAPLSFDAGPEWEIDYQGETVDFFSIRRPRGENVFFILSRWPAGGSAEQIPRYVHRMAKGLEETAASGLGSLLVKDGYEIEPIEGDASSGQAAVFTFRDRTVQSVYMISDGDGLWNGQFQGSRGAWDEAKALLGGLGRAGAASDEARNMTP